MPYTSTPRTWVAGEVPTATHFNDNLRDFARGFTDAWTSYTPTLTASTTNPTNWTQTGYYCRVGKLVIAKFKITASATRTVGSGTYYIALPVNANTNIDYAELGTCNIFLTTGSVGHKGHLQLDGTNQRARIEYVSAYPTGTVANVTHNTPFAWDTNSDTAIRGTLLYEAA